MVVVRVGYYAFPDGTITFLMKRTADDVRLLTSRIIRTNRLEFLGQVRSVHGPDMELGHWVTGSMGHLSRPGHRVIILTRCETRVFPVFEKSPR